MGLLLLILLLIPFNVSAQTNNIIISEIQTYGQTSKDEFIQLYNPTTNAIDISGWKLTKKTSSGSESNLVSLFPDGTTIPANSGFLITHKTDYKGIESADTTYSGSSYSIADNNTVILKDDVGTIVDKVGFGTATDYEGSPADNPENGSSIKRINNQDTDNNKNDFLASSPAVQTEQNTQNNYSPPTTQYGEVVINEVVPNPTEGKEWIEFYNTTSNSIDITGWKVSDSFSKIYDLSGSINADSFLIVEVNNRLNNTGDSISISDASNNSIHYLKYGDSTIPTPKKGESIARDADGNYFITQTPTKNYTNTQEQKNIKTLQQSIIENSTTSSTISQSSISDIKEYIIINEILPNPAGSDTTDEWIELYNSSNTQINLGELYLDDAEGGSNPYKILQNTIIKENDYLLFPRTKTNLALNNSDDSVRLLDEQKKEIKSVEYEDAKEGLSYSFYNNKWSWTSHLTPLALNIIKTQKQENIKTNSASNTATGIVVVEPNIFSTRTMYIDGLQLYMHTATWPTLKLGDKIKVYGTPSTYYNEPRLKLKDKNSIIIISQNNSIIPEKITGDDIEDELVGRLIAIEGEIIEQTSTKLFLDSNGTEILIYNKTNIKFSEYKEQDIIEVIGILNKYKDDYRILPRDKNDIKIIKKSEEKLIKSVDEKNPLWQYIISTLAIGGTSGALYIRRKRKHGRQDNFYAQTLE